jgi:hypothetical protein
MPAAIDEAMRKTIEKRIMAIASSKATRESKVVVKGPLAWYSRTIARIAAGAVALAIAPIMRLIGK